MATVTTTGDLPGSMRRVLREAPGETSVVGGDLFVRAGWPTEEPLEVSDVDDLADYLDQPRLVYARQPHRRRGQRWVPTHGWHCVLRRLVVAEERVEPQMWGQALAGFAVSMGFTDELDQPGRGDLASVGGFAADAAGTLERGPFRWLAVHAGGRTGAARDRFEVVHLWTGLVGEDGSAWDRFGDYARSQKAAAEMERFIASRRSDEPDEPGVSGVAV